MQTSNTWWMILPLVSCTASIKPASPPDLAPPRSESERQALYARYKLTAHHHVKWTRADGSYEFAELEAVAKQFPESQALYDRTRARGTVIGTAAGVGGGLAGGALGYNLTAPESERMSSGTQIALYSAGGGLMILSLALVFAWPDPSEDFAAVYNAALRKTLGLPKAMPEDGKPRSGWLPRPGARGFAWTF